MVTNGKKLIFIFGMGSMGKTTLAQELLKVLPEAKVFELDKHFWLNKELNRLFEIYQKNIYKATIDNFEFVGSIFKEIIKQEVLLDYSYFIFEGFSLYTIQDYIYKISEFPIFIFSAVNNKNYEVLYEGKIIENEEKIKAILNIVGQK